jgi:hypothetical protein
MEVKEVINFLGLDAEKIKSIDDLKKEFPSQFVRTTELKERTDLINPIVDSYVGKRLGSLDVDLKRTAKENGIELSEDEQKQKVEDLSKTILSKAVGAYKGQIAELKDKLDKGSNEVVKDWESKYNKLTQKLSEKETLLESTKGAYEKLQADSANQIKNFQISHSKKDVLSKVESKFKKNLSPLEREGFNTIIEKNYQLDLDEKEGLIVRTKDGKRIANEKVAGTYKSFLDVVEEEAIKSKIIELTPHKTTPIVLGGLGQKTENNGAGNPPQGRKMASR